MSKLATEGVQVGESAETCEARVANSAKIYTVRKDCQALKDQLLGVVKDPTEYWNTLARFLHGQCSKKAFDETMQGCLTTVEAKLLHNELIRSIIYNAHFTMIPPPNVTPPKPECPPHVRKVPPAGVQSQNASFMTYTASDMRHLPSLNQLSERIGILLNSRKISIESKAAALVFTNVKRYVMLILEGCVELVAVRKPDERTDVKITTDQVMHVLKMHSDLGSIVSPAVMSKYSNALA